MVKLTEKGLGFCRHMGGCCRVMRDRFGKAGGGFVGDKPSPEILVTSIHNMRKIDGAKRARCWGWGRRYRFTIEERDIGKVDIRRKFLRHCEKWQESLSSSRERMNLTSPASALYMFYSDIIL